jgi:two-component system NtrC family response regulator
MAHILVVDDEKNYCTVLAELLGDEGFRVSTAANPYAALEVMERENVDLVLSDLKMPGMSGLEFQRQVRAEIGDIPFIIFTAYATVETALDAMKSGAVDYLIKPCKNEEILLAVQKAVDYRRLLTQNAALRRELEVERSGGIIGSSPAVRKLLEDIERAASVRSSVLILGETGTGKELVARALHHAGTRAKEALVTVNCAAFAENLLESELFGHERGAFTGATQRKKGLLEVADGGTLFLDEIGEFPLSLQPKLLRALQEQRFRRVGGTVEVQSDVRIVAATHRDLQQMTATGAFREDLYYRLNVVVLEIPPLRRRREDIPLLALHFLRRSAREMDRPVRDIAPETIERLQNYSWPGNVRELQNVMERSVLFSSAEILTPADLPVPLGGVARDGDPADSHMPDFDAPLPDLMDRMEKELIRKALRQAGGVQAQAADLLGISRSNLQYKLKKHHLI